jgi:predicted DNA-binding helix-hairpin-helix protein
MNRTEPRLWLHLAVLTLLLSIVSAPSAQVGRSRTMTEPNMADDKQLLKLPHLNATVVNGIVARRPFSNMIELNKFLAQTLNNQQLAELYALMFLPINLNTATREEILLIPGMGNRMVREFLEYRPYTSLAQFRKEIGKYVDDKEVARLEQYVFVPININTASDEILSSLPGASPQSVRAIKESRPYKDMEHFRREMTKATSAKDAVRLERYFVIN